MHIPSELRKKEFTKVIKGYSQSEVDEYISYLVSEYAEAVKSASENEKKYKNALAKLEEAKNDESAISALILNAQKMADTIVTDANAKAKAITDAVSESCDKILATYREKVAEERDKLRKTEKLAADFKESLYAAYRKHVSAIEKILPEENEENSISTATDEELVDSAVELAGEKYKENLDEIDLPPLHSENDEKTENKK